MPQAARKQQETTDVNVSEAIRDEIAKIPRAELLTAKPGRVLEKLPAGIEITGSVRAMTSRLLSAARKAEAESFRPRIAKGTVDLKMMAALAFVEACGSLGEARAVLKRLEDMTKR